jgi:peptidoglycan hydrolase CwlO-like protein
MKRLLVQLLFELLALTKKLGEKVDHINQKQGQLMSAISDFAARQTAFNGRIDAAVTGLQGDVKFLQDKIDELQNSAGQITPEDQALLDDIDARADAVATKLEALDALTPPTPPATP